MAYFAAAPEAEPVIAAHAKPAAWWDIIRQRGSLRDTEPGLPPIAA
jgi:hypothetical protein